MSFMRGDLFCRTRKLVKGLAQTEPLWLKAMEQAPPATFPRPEGKIKTITLPEDVYIKKFYKKYPDSKYYDAINASVRRVDQAVWSPVKRGRGRPKRTLNEVIERDLLVNNLSKDLLLIEHNGVVRSMISAFDPPPSRVYASRVLELTEHGVTEAQAMAVADREYRAEVTAKKQAYARLRQIARLQGKKPPPNPYPSAVREIQAEERKYVRARFFDPKIRKIVEQQKADYYELRRQRGGMVNDN